MSQFMQPGIILLREGTDTSQGRGQLISNINACQAVGDIIRTTLGPRGMDKLVYSGMTATISNDGAEILKLLEIVHPAARALVDIAKSQDTEVGDGTTSVTLLACELLKMAKAFIEDGEHPQTVIKGYKKAGEIAQKKISELSIGIKDFETLVSKSDFTFTGFSTQTTEEKGKEVTQNDILRHCAATALNSKLIARNKAFFSQMCVDALSYLEDDLDLDLIGIKKITGGSVSDSMLIPGVAFQKTFSYAGFEQQPKKLIKPKILALNVELELKNEKDNAEVRLDNPDKYQSIVEAEWQIIYDKLEACVKTGATVVLSKLAIGDLGTQYFADRGIFCAGRVQIADLKRVCQATGAKILSTTSDIPATALGEAGLFEEKQVGPERYNFFTECEASKTSTIIIRGGSQQFVEEAHRSLHDALMIVKRTMQTSEVVPGGGAIEMEIAKAVENASKKISGKHQLVLEAFAKAMEIIPQQLCVNAGLDSTDVLNLLRKKHFVENEKWFGVDINESHEKHPGVFDTLSALIWEPSTNKRNAVASAVEAACLILSIDETVINPQSEQAQMQQRGQTSGGNISAAMGGGGMKGMGQMMGGGKGMKMLKGRGGK